MLKLEKKAHKCAYILIAQNDAFRLQINGRLNHQLKVLIRSLASSKITIKKSFSDNHFTKNHLIKTPKYDETN